MLAIVDAGALVAFLDRREAHHAWVAEAAAKVRVPWKTCEPALAEAWHLLGRATGGRQVLLDMLRSGLVSVQWSLAAELEAVAGLVDAYGDVPMSLADACLVRMAEQLGDHVVFTLDSDFSVYRKNGSEQIPLLSPPR